MTVSPQTYYLNSEFDLSLRPRPRQIDRPRLARQVRELTVQALLGARAGDAALVRAEVPQEFLAYLLDCGLALPRLLMHPCIDPAGRWRPFGWTAEAIELNRLHHEPMRHPPVSVIRRVNSRSFSLELERELAPEGPSGAVVESRPELEAFLARAAPESEWVIKAEHGNSGLANRRLRCARLTEADRRFVEGHFAEDDQLVVEPWLARERDWCAVFEVPFDGATLRIHETINTRDGAFIGALFLPGRPENAPELDELVATAERVAARLEAESYFGHVCMDAFCWRDEDRVRLRPLVDLNCRLSVSDGAFRLGQRLAPDRAFYYRFFNRRKLRLPADLPGALDALGEDRYDRGRRRGILLASPLELGSGDDTWRPGKLAVILVADDRSGVFELERRFRERFEV